MGLKTRQWKEIQDIKQYAEENPALFEDLAIILMVQLEEAKSFTNDPEKICQREALLDNINSSLIKRKIDRASTLLNISNIGLTRFPAKLLADIELKEYWQSLKMLNLSDNKIRFLPNTIDTLMDLESMSCCRNKLDSLPDSIGCLFKLKKLLVSNNELSTLPETISNLTSLSWLSFNNNLMETLPDFSNLKALTDVDCSDNQLTDLSESIEKLPALRILNCNGNPLTLDVLQRIESIQILALREDPFLIRGPKIKPELKQLLEDPTPTTDLEVIMQRSKLFEDYYSLKRARESERIVGLPQWAEIKHFQERAEEEPSFFEGLDPILLQELQSAEMTQDPPILDKRDRMLDSINIFLIQKNIDPKSTELNLVDKGLTRLPEKLLEDDLEYWGSLRELSISGNQIRTLPKEGLVNLKSLKKLDCGENSLVELPETIGCLENLEYLRASDNNLIGLPESINNLKKLKNLFIRENKIKTLPGMSFSRLPELAGQGDRLEKLLGELITISDLHLECDENLEADPRITTFYPEGRRPSFLKK